MSAVPDVARVGTGPGRIRLVGDPTDSLHAPSGCRFRGRCWKARERCATEEPALVRREGGAQLTACHFPETATVTEAKP